MSEQKLRINTSGLFKTADPSRDDELKLAGEILEGLDVNKILLGLNCISRQTREDPSRFVSRQELVEASQLTAIAKLVFSGDIEKINQSRVNFFFNNGGKKVYFTLMGDNYFSCITYEFSLDFPGNVSISFDDPSSQNPDINTKIKLYDSRSNQFSHSIRVQDDPYTLSLLTYNESDRTILVQTGEEIQIYPVES